MYRMFNTRPHMQAYVSNTVFIENCVQHFKQIHIDDTLLITMPDISQVLALQFIDVMNCINDAGDK